MAAKVSWCGGNHSSMEGKGPTKHIAVPTLISVYDQGGKGM